MPRVLVLCLLAVALSGCIQGNTGGAEETQDASDMPESLRAVFTNDGDLPVRITYELITPASSFRLSVSLQPGESFEDEVAMDHEGTYGAAHTARSELLRDPGVGGSMSFDHDDCSVPVVEYLVSASSNVELGGFSINSSSDLVC